jgi:hypothetical protein
MIAFIVELTTYLAIVALYLAAAVRGSERGKGWPLWY